MRQRGFWSSSRVIQKPSPSLRAGQKREKKKKKSARETTREKPTPSRTRSSRNRAEFGRNERSRGEVYRPTFRFFSLSLRAPSRFFFSLLRANAREKIPLQVFSLSHKNREKNLGSHAKTRVHKKINKKSLSKTGASRERPSRAKTPLSKEKDAYLGRKRSR